MTNEERIKKAREWRAANLARAQHADDALSAEMFDDVELSDMQRDALCRTSDSSWGVIDVIDALFPELKP
jgi:hypothetical protein